MSRHPLGRIDGYLEGGLSERRRQRVAAHLEDCPYCRDLARERSVVLAAARRVERTRSSATAPPGAAAPQEAEAAPGSTVLAARGVPGCLVVGGLAVLAAALLLAGGTAAVWAAGDPAESGTGAGIAEARSIVAGAEADAASEESSPEAVSAAVAQETGAAVRALRRHGWAVPSLRAAGLRPMDVDVVDGAEVVEVAVDWGDGERTVRVRECRGIGSSRAPSSCPGRDAGPTVAQRTLPVGVAYHVTADDGRDGWAAVLPVGHARYVVSSDLPRDRLEPLLSMMVLAERSGVAEDQQGAEQVVERLERGLGRLKESLLR